MPRESSDRPNILFVLTDDHASQAIGAYADGSAPETIADHLAGSVETPNIDRIGAEGVRFDNAFCTNALCAPARATVMTGQYSHHNGIRVNEGTLDESQWTVSRALHDHGYRTGLIGKWHLESGYVPAAGDPPGFDHYEVLAGQGAHWDPTLHTARGKTKHEGYAPDIITDRSIAWLDDHDDDAPFFLNVGYKATHGPWVPVESDFESIPERVPQPATFHDEYETRADGALPGARQIEKSYEYLRQADRRKEGLEAIPDGLSDREEREWIYQQFVRRYLATVRGVDRNVGRLLQYLDSKGLAEDTLVVYTADHGFFLGEHGLVNKRHMYEPSLRIPHLVRWPGVTAAGAVQDALVANVDFAPTLLDAAGIATPNGVQGESLCPLMTGETPSDWRTSVYYRSYIEGWGGIPQEGVRTEEHKVINFHTLGTREYYDLCADPNELHNLRSDPDAVRLRRDLDERLEVRRADYGIPSPAAD